MSQRRRSRAAGSPPGDADPPPSLEKALRIRPWPALGSDRRVLALALAFRAANALLVRTYFNPTSTASASRSPTASPSGNLASPLLIVSREFVKSARSVCRSTQGNAMVSLRKKRGCEALIFMEVYLEKITKMGLETVRFANLSFQISSS